MKNLKILFWKFIKLLPAPIRARHTRMLYKADLNYTDGPLRNVRYKVAETYDEYLQAFKLVQDNYKRLGMTKSDDFIKTTKFNLLPTTLVMIAMNDDEVIATVSLVIDNSLGLPTEEYQDISFLRKNGARIVEIGALTVKEEWRSRSRGVFIPLTCYCNYYAREIIGAKYAVISIRKSVQSFYEDIYLFKQLGEVKKYDGVNNLKSVSMYTDLTEQLEETHKVYRNSPMDKSVYEHAKLTPWKNICDLTLPKYQLLTKHIFTTDEIKSLFTELSHVIDELEDKEKSIVKNYYERDNFIQNMTSSYDEIMAKRADQRFFVNLSARIITDERVVPVSVLDVSSSGLSLYSDYEIDGAQYYNIIIDLADKTSIKLKLNKEWSKASRKFGFSIVKKENTHWNEMINYFTTYLYGEEEVGASNKKAS